MWHSLSFVFWQNLKIPLDWLQSQTTCVQGEETGSYLKSESSLGRSPPSQSGCDDALFCEGLREAGKGLQERLVPFWVCPWHAADLIPIDPQPETLVSFGPIGISLLPQGNQLGDQQSPFNKATCTGAGLICASILFAFQITWRLQVFFGSFILTEPLETRAPSHTFNFHTSFHWGNEEVIKTFYFTIIP